MKLPTQHAAKFTALGIVALFTALSSVASAADFNPQPDPPGKSKTLNVGQHSQPDDKVLHNPPAFKSADTRVLLPAVKTDKTKQLDTKKVGAAQDVKN